MSSHVFPCLVERRRFFRLPRPPFSALPPPSSVEGLGGRFCFLFLLRRLAALVAPVALAVPAPDNANDSADADLGFGFDFCCGLHFDFCCHCRRARDNSLLESADTADDNDDDDEANAGANAGALPILGRPPRSTGGNFTVLMGLSLFFRTS